MIIIAFLFNLFLFLLPLTFLPHTSELFEFNKMVLTYAFTIAIAFFWAKRSIDKNKFVFKKTPLDIPIIIFLGSLALSTITSIDTRTSILGYYGRFHGGLLSYFSYAVLYWAFVSNVNKKQALNMIRTILISLGVSALYAALEHFGKSPSCLVITGNFNVSCWVQDIQTRVFGTFGQPNWLAAWLVAVIPLTWAKTIRHPGANKVSDRISNKILSAFGLQNDILLYFLLFAIAFVTLLFTKSRSGMLGFAFAFFVFWPSAFYIYRRKAKRLLPSFLLTTGYFLLAIIFIWNPLAPISEPPVPGVTESGDIRKIVWEGAVELWKRYPLLGTGPETFAYSYYETRPVEHNLTSEWNFVYNRAHNEYLNFAATTGTVGFSGYLILIISSLIVLLKNRKNIFSLALLSGYVSILITNFFGFSTVAIAVLFFLFPAMAQKLK